MNKKLFSIIPYKEGLIAVDKDVPIKGWYYTNNIIESIGWWNPQATKTDKDFQIVAASASASLGLDVPVLDAPDIHYLSDKWARENGVKNAGVLVNVMSPWRSIEAIWEAGYKAAGGYTEEQMKDCFKAAREDRKDNKDHWKYADFSHYIDKHPYLKPLSKTPTGVWLEMEYKDDIKEEKHGNIIIGEVTNQREEIKLTSDNHVIVVGWEY